MPRRLSISTAGRALLTEDTWDHNYELIFAIEYLMAECELLTGRYGGGRKSAFDAGRTRQKRSRYRRRHTFAPDALHHFGSERPRVEVCLEYLRRCGHRLVADIRRAMRYMREYDRIWSLVGSRQIEELVDLPLMTDPDILDVLDVLTEVVTPALFADENLFSLVICQMVNLSLEHGNCDGSCFAYVWFGDHRRAALRQLQGRISLRSAWL